MKNEKIVQGVNWDLSDLYSSIVDPKIEQDKNTVLNLTNELTKKYKGKINSEKLTTETLISFFKELENLYTILNKLSSYSSNSFNINTSDKDLAKFYQSIKELIAKISSELAWADLEITFAADEIIKSVLNNKEINESYAEHINSLRALKNHRLSESEEKLITNLSQSGSSAFKRFYNETFSSIKFPVLKNNKIENVGYGEIISIIGRDENREKRKRASASFSKVLKQESKTFGYILNTLLLDKKIEDEVRNFEYPQQSTLLSYRIDKEVVDALVAATQKYYFSVEKFYKQKAKIQNIKKLTEYDRYSKILPQKQTEVSWEKAKDLVLAAFHSFSPDFSALASDFFEKKWIDSKVTEGKTSGAYCSSTCPSYHPLVLMNFVGTMNDVFTLAHELGHGIHDCLSKNQNLLSYYPSIATAEIASVFAEMVTFEHLLSKTLDKTEKINLLGEHLQNTFATIFRQSAFYLFESDIHMHRREKGELSIEEFNKYFQDRLQAMFGKGLKLSEDHAYWWSPISHFYKYNFYVFTYSFGQALTLALYARYKKEGESFIKKYVKVLSMGGSKPPAELISELGIDIRDKKFWDEGLGMIDKKVDEFIELSNS